MNIHDNIKPFINFNDCGLRPTGRLLISFYCFFGIRECIAHFLQNRPSGKIDQRLIEIGCNSAVDAGIYTFTFGKTGAVVKARYSYTYAWNGKSWLITSHHSSAMPEKG